MCGSTVCWVDFKTTVDVGNAVPDTLDHDPSNGKDEPDSTYFLSSWTVWSNNNPGSHEATFGTH